MFKVNNKNDWSGFYMKFNTGLKYVKQAFAYLVTLNATER